MRLEKLNQIREVFMRSTTVLSKTREIEYRIVEKQYPRIEKIVNARLKAVKHIEDLRKEIETRFDILLIREFLATTVNSGIKLLYEKCIEEESKDYCKELAIDTLAIIVQKALEKMNKEKS